MPAWLLRYLPHGLIVLAVVGLLGGLILFIDHRGYERASRDRDEADAKMAALIRSQIRDFEQRSITRENTRAVDTKGLLDRIDANTRDGRDRIIKEMTHEIRFTDPALGIPGSVRDDINRALAASACAATADGGIRCAVPEAGAAGEH